ncbi:signal recognition particle receptor subunit beta isoform X4 [Gossypium hirsutum]|uniref:Signal recognition particle receptor subunit beta n=1 Tax=Gossypium hirsutum TaxID=3635 RepID=A0ABM3AHS2_GOSHI|nr:signal recognition particle receptor subunit beta isoform X4 [Gossypium hirsutum]
MEGMEQWKDQLEQLKIQLEPWKIQLEQWLHQAIEYLHQIPPIQLYAAIAVLFISTLLLFSICLFKRTKSNTIVLTGLTGSGKTVLFYVLRDGSSHQGTVTSMEPNEGTFVLNSESNKKGKIKSIHLVDVPGHSRLRPKLDEFLPQAAGIVFVVDAVEFLPSCPSVSDEKLRASRSAISAADISNDFTLGVSGEIFSFTQCRNAVTVADASGLKGEVAQVEQFIREHVKP